MNRNINFIVPLLIKTDTIPFYKTSDSSAKLKSG